MALMQLRWYAAPRASRFGSRNRHRALHTTGFAKTSLCATRFTPHNSYEMDAIQSSQSQQTATAQGQDTMTSTSARQTAASARWMGMGSVRSRRLLGRCAVGGHRVRSDGT